MALSQANRPIAVTTPLGDDKLLLEKFKGKESISRPFGFDLVMLSQPDYDLKFEDLLGQSVTIRLNNQTGDPRYFNGIVNRLSEGQEVRSPDSGAVFKRYFAQVVPKFVLLNNVSQSRIFQQKTVKEILTAVLTGVDNSIDLTTELDARDYCVQYRETDFQFASRLMEEEGMRYYFQHTNGGHKLMITDQLTTLTDLPGGAAIEFSDQRGLRDRGITDDRVVGWQKTQEMRPGKFTLRDHYFQDPAKTLEATQTVLATVAVGTVTHKLKVGGNDTHERYDFPGGYVRRYDGIDPGGAVRTANVVPDSDRTAKVRMEQETASALSISGESNVRRMAPGYKFTLSKHFNADGGYLLTEVEHAGSIEGTYTTTELVPLKYKNQFSCVPSALPYRPSRTTAKPSVRGTQTAVVVGDSATAEITTDKYGRVKVQFFWDRLGQNNMDSSCWVRVAQPWAGKLWGAIALPRVGQEVVVDFLEGDPDQPIILGSVYNADQMPPYTLPDNKTRTTIKTRSSEKGTDENFSELRFEDKKDSEEIYFHAEKDFNRVVENNDTLKVGFEKKDAGNQTIEIYNSRTERVQEGDEKVTIEKGARTITVTKKDNKLEVTEGNRIVHVGQGNDTHDVTQGNRKVTVGQGNDTHEVSTGNLSVTVSQGNASYTITAGKSSTEAGQEISLKVGGNSIVINTTGITIKAAMISIESQAKLDMKGVMTTVNGDATLTAKGGIVKIN